MQQQKTSDNNFMKYFNAKVAPIANNVENYRPKIIKGAVIWASLIGLIPLPVIIFVLMSNILITEKLYLVAFCIIFFCIIIASCIFSSKKIYALFAKEQLIPALLGFWGNFTYVAPPNFIAALYRTIKNKTGLGSFIAELTKDKKTNISINPTILARLLKFQNIDYDDKIVGRHADVPIELAELETYFTTVEKKSDGKTETHKSVTFKGIVFSASMNKKFKGITVVSYEQINKNRVLYPRIEAKHITNMDLNDVLAFGKQLADAADAIKTEMDGKSLKEFAEERANMPEQKQNNTGDKSKIHDTLQDVYLEDPMFAKRFKMCSTDQIEARYIFTTAFMSRFMKVAETFNYKLKAIFIDNNVYILINADKNWFELPFFKSCTDPTNYKAFLIDFSRLISIVDVLKLNQNIGM